MWKLHQISLIFLLEKLMKVFPYPIEAPLVIVPIRDTTSVGAMNTVEPLMIVPISTIPSMDTFNPLPVVPIDAQSEIILPAVSLPPSRSRQQTFTITTSDANHLVLPTSPTSYATPAIPHIGFPLATRIPSSDIYVNDPQSSEILFKTANSFVLPFWVSDIPIPSSSATARSRILSDNDVVYLTPTLSPYALVSSFISINIDSVSKGLALPSSTNDLSKSSESRQQSTTFVVVTVTVPAVNC